MTLPAQDAPVWKRDNLMKEVYSTKSETVRMLRNQSLAVFSNTRAWEGGRRVTRSHNKFRGHWRSSQMGKPLVVSEYRETTSILEVPDRKYLGTF